jgi:hypothetical protein
MILRSNHPQLLKLCIPFLIILLAFSPAVLADNNATGVERMVRQIEALFPVLEGYVLSAEGNRVAIDLKRGQNITTGQTLKLIRYGKPITHPVTKKVVGHEETDLGQIKILEVRKDYSIAQVVTPGVKAEKGDGVRSAFKKVKLLVAPVQADPGVTGNPQALGLEIETQLNRHIRFEVPTFDLDIWLLENEVPLSSLARPENLKRLRQKVAVDSILLTRVRTIKGQTVMGYRLVSSSDGSVLKEARTLIPDLPTAPPPLAEQEIQSDFGKKDKGPFRFEGKQDFDFELVDFAVGDLTGKGHKDYVIIDDHRVMVYRYQKGKFKKVGQVKLQKSVHKFISVDVADINGNGRDEIFVTDSLGDNLSSFVLEAVPGRKGLTPIAENLNRYFRVLRDFNGSPLLISQRPEFEKPFQPGIQKMHPVSGGYSVDSELSLSVGDYPDLNIYGLALGRVTPAKSKETIFLDNNYHLRVYSPGGRLLVSSNEYFGHDPRLIEVGLKEQVAGTFIDYPDAPQPVRFKGRLQLIQHNARKFLLVPKNHRIGSFLSTLVIVKHNSLVLLGVTPEGLEKVYETKKQRGYLAAFQVVDTANKKQKRVQVASVADHGGFLGGKKISTIYTYIWGR